MNLLEVDTQPFFDYNVITLSHKGYRINKQNKNKKVFITNQGKLVSEIGVAQLI